MSDGVMGSASIGRTSAVGPSGGGQGALGSASLMMVSESTCSGCDDMNRVVAIGYGMGPLGEWEYTGFNAVGGMYVDGSRGVCAGNFNANAGPSLPPRYWKVPLQYGVDLDLAFASSIVPAIEQPILEVTFWPDNVAAGIDIRPTVGDPNNGARTDLDLFFEHLGSYDYWHASVQLPAGLWNGPTTRLELRVEDTRVVACLYDKTGAQPDWQVVLDLTGQSGPDGELHLADYFHVCVGSPNLRWDGPIWNDTRTTPAILNWNANKSILYFDNVCFSGCEENYKTSFEDLFDRTDVKGLFGVSPIRLLPWGMTLWTPGSTVTPENGAVFRGDTSIGYGSGLWLAYGSVKPGSDWFPGGPPWYGGQDLSAYRDHFAPTGPNATSPFEMEIEFTPSLQPDPWTPGAFLYWAMGVEIQGGGHRGGAYIYNTYDDVLGGYTDQLVVYALSDDELGYGDEVPVGASGETIRLTVHLDETTISAGGSVVSHPAWDMSDTNTVYMPMDWDWPAAEAELLRIRRFAIPQGLGDCSFASGGGGAGGPTACGFGGR